MMHTPMTDEELRVERGKVLDNDPPHDLRARMLATIAARDKALDAEREKLFALRRAVAALDGAMGAWLENIDRHPPHARDLRREAVARDKTMAFLKARITIERYDLNTALAAAQAST